MAGIIYNTIGNSGVVIILVTYFLLQTERLRPDTLLYSVLNLCGSSMILVSLFYQFNLPSFFIEIFWMAISAYGIVKALRKRARQSAN